MSSFKFGFVISKLQKFNRGNAKVTETIDTTVPLQPEIQIWTLSDRKIPFEVRN